jgi:hypothetical protein
MTWVSVGAPSGSWRIFPALVGGGERRCGVLSLARHELKFSGIDRVRVGALRAGCLVTACARVISGPIIFTAYE